MSTRKYRQSKRLEQQQETRQRIVDAAVTLHERLGPANTSIKAIAESAGVQRLTVYRHFEDEAAIFDACTSHWLSLHPPPEPSQWEHHDDPVVRLRRALAAFYLYYEETSAMWHGAYRDVEKVPSLQKHLHAFESFLDETRDVLTTGFGAKGASRKQLAATIGHALRFATWRSLGGEGLDEPAMVRLVVSWVNMAAPKDRQDAAGQ